MIFYTLYKKFSNLFERKWGRNFRRFSRNLNLFLFISYENIIKIKVIEARKLIASKVWKKLTSFWKFFMIKIDIKSLENSEMDGKDARELLKNDVIYLLWLTLKQ